MSDDPKELPSGVREFLAAISVQPNITKAARAAAEVVGTFEPAEHVGPAIRRTGSDEPESEAEIQARAERRQRQVRRVAQRIRWAHKDRMRTDEAYAAAFKAAYSLGSEATQDLAVERAMDGWTETVEKLSANGLEVTTKHKFSEREHLRLLEVLFPETWGKRKVEHSGNVQVGLRSLTDDELDRRIAAEELRISRLAERETPAEAAVQQDPDLLPGDGPA